MTGMPEPKVINVICGAFTFTYIGPDSMVIEKPERGQSLTLEAGETYMLANKLTEIAKIFQEDYCKPKRCRDCEFYHGEKTKYCPLEGHVGSDCYCWKFIQRTHNFTPKPKRAIQIKEETEEPIEVDGEQE